MRALITGATGFIGNRLVTFLADAGWDVLCLARDGRRPSRRGIKVFTGDLLQPQTLTLDEAADTPIDVVFHLAALMPCEAISDAERFIQANGSATARLLEACGRHSIGRFVYLSSISVIGVPRSSPIDEMHPTEPKNAYALGKLVGEMACSIARERGMLATAFRLASPYGPSMAPGTVLANFVRKRLTGDGPHWMGNGLRRQDFIHVDDVVRALMLAAQAPTAGTYCLGSGESISMRALAELIASMIPGDKASASKTPDPQEGFDWRLDITKARRELGFHPAIRLEDGLAQYIAGEDTPPFI